MKRSTIYPVHILAIAVLALACSKPEPPKTPLGRATVTDSLRTIAGSSVPIAPAAAVALDSGNDLFRKKAYGPALAQYRAAAALAPENAAPLFGIYMVARATNDAKLADSALAGIRARARASAVPD